MCRQQCEPVPFAGSKVSHCAGRQPVQLHTHEGCELEHHADGHRGFPVLGIAQRRFGDAGALAQLSLRPPTLPTPSCDPQTQYACGSAHREPDGLRERDSNTRLY